MHVFYNDKTDLFNCATVKFNHNWALISSSRTARKLKKILTLYLISFYDALNCPNQQKR